MRRAGDAGNLPSEAVRRLVTLLGLALTVALLPPPVGQVAAQELPTQPASPPAVEPTPAPAEPTSAAQAAGPAEFTAGAPHVHTVAQGLVSIEGPVAWRVRENGLSANGAPETATASFILPRV